MPTIPTTIQGTLIELGSSDKDRLEDLIRRFESATRYAYARICDGVRVLDIEKDVAIERVCLKRGVSLEFINPAFTSFIGKKKYMPAYKFLVVHEAAAYVIARRGQGFKEVPKGSLREKALKALEARKGKNLHLWSLGRALKPKRAANSGKRKPAVTKGDP